MLSVVNVLVLVSLLLRNVLSLIHTETEMETSENYFETLAPDLTWHCFWQLLCLYYKWLNVTASASILVIVSCCQLIVTGRFVHYFIISSSYISHCRRFFISALYQALGRSVLQTDINAQAWYTSQESIWNSRVITSNTRHLKPLANPS